MGLLPEAVATFAADVDEWFTTHYAGADWRSSGLQGTLPWKELPLSTVWAPIGGVVLYAIGVVVAQRFMRNRDPIDCTKPLLVHNLLLTVFSVVMFIGTLRLAVRHSLQHGLFATWMDPDWLLPRTEVPWWNYAFYVSKYYELLDTLFLILKKRKLQAVQVYHHATVMFLFWSCINARITIQIVPVMANSFAHIFVYGYFTAASLKIPVPWKRYITVIQLGQFVIDIANALPWPWFKMHGQSRGDWGPMLCGHVLAGSFIILFGQVYTRIRKDSKGGKDGKGGKGA